MLLLCRIPGHPTSMSIEQVHYYHSTTPRDANTYDKYVSESTPKRLPSIETPPRYASASPVNNYTYNAASSPGSDDSQSPIKNQVVEPAGVKLPSFRTLLQSIHSEPPAATLETPLINSLHLENARSRVSSVQSSPSSKSELNNTFFETYNYSRLQFEDPYRQEQPRYLAANLPVRPQSLQLSPLQFQQERFSRLNYQQPQPLPQQVSAQIHPVVTVVKASTEKRFKCKVCSRGFNTAGNLSRHKKVHTGEKKYLCQYPGCESKFARSDSCMQHYRTHANENGYTSRRFKRLRTDDDEEEEEEEELETSAGQKKMRLDALMS